MLLAIVVLAVMMTAGCGTINAQVDDNGFQRITQTEVSQVATGFPVWLQKKVKIDEFGWNGLDSKTMVGYLYCENVAGSGPRCVPVKVEDIPVEMMIPEVTVENLPLTSSANAHPVGRSYFSNNSDVSENVVAARSEADSSVKPTNEREIFNMNVKWDETTLKSILSLYVQQKIIVETKKGNSFSGTLVAIFTSETDLNPRLIILDEQGRKFGVKLELISKILQ